MSFITENSSAASIKEFWDTQAAQYRESDIATAPDHYYRELEISRILPHIPSHAKVLDVGCGNGYSTAIFARERPRATFMGIDFSETMIKSAIKKPKQNNLSFAICDVLDLNSLGQKFNTVISTRCLINLKGWNDQAVALKGIREVLETNGRLILVENTKEGLANLNKLRLQQGLLKIKERWHNSYLPQRDLMTFLRPHFKLMHMENIGNFYYMVSRVIYAKLAQMEGKTPEYNHPINKIASEMPSLPGYYYSPNFMWILKAI